MTFKTRPQLAKKHGLTMGELNSRLKNSWSDFPAPAHKIGTVTYYEETEADFYIINKLEIRQKLLDKKLANNSTPETYFGGQKFLKVFIR